MKKQHMEWEKIFTDHIPDKGLISKTHKNSCNSISKEQSNLKMGRGSEQTFFTMKTYGRLTSTGKGTQHHLSPGKCLPQ